MYGSHFCWNIMFNYFLAVLKKLSWRVAGRCFYGLCLQIAYPTFKNVRECGNITRTFMHICGSEICDVINFPASYTDTRCLCYIKRLYVILEPDEEFMERIRDVIVLLWPWYWSDRRFKSDQASQNLRSDSRFRCYDWSIAWPIYSFVQWASK